MRMWMRIPRYRIGCVLGTGEAKQYDIHVYMRMWMRMPQYIIWAMFKVFDYFLETPSAAYEWIASYWAMLKASD
jgi:hypothetical protein